MILADCRRAGSTPAGFLTSLNSTLSGLATFSVSQMPNSSTSRAMAAPPLP